MNQKGVNISSSTQGMQAHAALLYASDGYPSWQNQRDDAVLEPAGMD
jgi:hypothetical protein